MREDYDARNHTVTTTARDVADVWHGCRTMLAVVRLVAYARPPMMA